MDAVRVLLALLALLLFSSSSDAATCSVYGDLHYITFDGAFIDYQGTCRHQLVDICGSGPPTFQVYMKGELRCGSTAFSWALYVEVVENGHIIRITRNSDGSVSATVDGGAAVALPYTGTGFTLTADMGAIVYSSSNVQVRFNGFSAYVTVGSAYAGLTCGMCGNFNGNPSDDYVKKDGTVVTQDAAGGKEMGDSWIVSGTETCDPTPSVTTPCVPTTIMQSYCDAITSSSTLYYRCLDSAILTILHTNCLIDLCVINTCNTVVSLFYTAIKELVATTYPTCLPCPTAEQCICPTLLQEQLSLQDCCYRYCQCSLGTGCIRCCPPAVDPSVPICVDSADVPPCLNTFCNVSWIGCN